MTETLRVKFDDEQTARIIYEVTEKLMLDANRIKVVRCKDCKYKEQCLQEVDLLVNKSIRGFSIDYCSYGERKDE